MRFKPEPIMLLVLPRVLVLPQGSIEGGGFWGFRKPLLTTKHFYNNQPQ